MMSDTKVLIEELDTKVNLLIAKLGEVSEGSMKKDQVIAELQSDLAMKEGDIVRMNEELVELKTVKPDTEQENLKVKIGEMVKEIDNCISLLKV